MDRVPRFKLRGSSLVDAELGYWGWLLDLDRFGSRGGGVCSGWSCLGPRTGDGWAEAEKGKIIQK